MILVLGGTQEGREIAGMLAGAGYEVLATVVSGYGAGMMDGGRPVEVIVKRLDSRDLKEIIRARNIRLIVDATHPYATVITETAWNTAQETGIPYIRFERPAVIGHIDQERVYRAGSYREAAELAASMGGTVFLTIGSKNLAPFVAAGRAGAERVVARVLPDPGVLEQCLALGMAQKDIIAVQGPFSCELNLAMFREYKAGVLVTKDSGAAGGTDTKLQAAKQMRIPVIIIERPDYRGIPVTDSMQEILSRAAGSQTS